ncbi:AI-2E family transporter [Cellulomonas sp. DKR-3]|uniref:AI-2E family transporter n=1 Tax=Cellulomonas fulva TaxID=2835530 RepID=A0ABS5U095_9CELL|nr:AI-2E family transporter [Cellulomonas fulva]MBT0994822.1 AI-2E family transporter [Cellulomonas fulva]
MATSRLAPHPERRPPAWLGRALLMAVAAVFLGILAWRALAQLSTVTTIVVLSWFIALAMEPSIRWLVRRGLRRTRATGLVMLTGIAGGVVVLALFGNLFVQQVVDFAAHVPEYYAQLAEWLDESFDLQIPTADEAVSSIGDHWQNFAPSIIGAGISIVGAFFTATSIGLVTYYMASAGPRFRASVLRYLEPARQREVLRVWEVSQEKVADFITSRLVLAALSAGFTWIFLIIVDVPYALALAAFTGIVSQFVPTIGTYIGGALPVAVALTISPVKALIVLAWIIAYQQIENLIFSPKVSAKALELNPAISFLGVIAFGAVFGAMGAFLALPVMATIQAVSSTYVRRHELVDDPLLHEDVEALRRHRHWTDVEQADDAQADDALVRTAGAGGPGGSSTAGGDEPGAPTIRSESARPDEDPSGGSRRD